MTIETQIGRLQAMTASQLQAKHIEAFAEATSGHNKAWLVKRIARRMQALAEGPSPSGPGSGQRNWPSTPISGRRSRGPSPSPRPPSGRRSCRSGSTTTIGCRCPAPCYRGLTRGAPPRPRLCRRVRVGREGVPVAPSGGEGDHRVARQRVPRLPAREEGGQGLSRRSIPTDAPKKTEIRCAIYTRKSTEGGLQQEFNSLDAQRESGEARIKSQ